MSDVNDHEPDEADFDADDLPEDQGDTDPPEGGEDDEEVEVGFDGEAGALDDTEAMRQMRALIAQQAKQLRERPPPEEPPIDPGPKPTMETCEYDEEKYEAALDKWKDEARKRDEQVERAQSSSRAAADTINADFLDAKERFGTAKKALKLPNFDAAEAAVTTALDGQQLAILLMACEGDSAKMIYALGKSPAKLEELAAIKNPARLAAQVARLEGKVTVKSRRQTVDVDEPVRGSAQRSTPSADKREEKLIKQARESGDRGPLIRYRKEKQAAAKK